jgi:hypothetical protein
VHDAEPVLLAERIASLIATAHAQWSALDERRRMRAFGFRPAVEAGVLKREWRGLQIRISIAGIVAGDDSQTLVFRAADRSLTVGDAPFALPEHETIADVLLELIREYERWVEAREGREERIRRGRDISRDRRPVNALAETRRLQRALGQRARTGSGRP